MKKFKKCKVCSSKINSINTKYELVKCENCNLIFCDNVFSEQEIINVYDKLYNKTTQYSKHIEEHNFLKENKNPKLGSEKIKILDYLINKNVTNVCEIGAGVGIVANYLQNIKKIMYYGIELDEKTAKKAMSNGLNVVNDSFTNLDTFESKFEAIVAFEVIEHIQELDDFFKQSIKSLTPDGYIGFTVPNYDKVKNYKNVGNHIHQDEPPIHLNFFNLENTNKVLAFYNLEIKFLVQRKYPYFNINVFDTYKFFIKSLFGKFHGQTLLCVAQKCK